MKQSSPRLIMRIVIFMSTLHVILTVSYNNLKEDNHTHYKATLQITETCLATILQTDHHEKEVKFSTLRCVLDATNITSRELESISTTILSIYAITATTSNNNESNTIMII